MAVVELDCCVNNLVASIVTAISVARINVDVVYILVLIPAINKFTSNMYYNLLCGILSRKVLQAAFAFRTHAVPPGKCDYLLDVTPSNPQPHPLSSTSHYSSARIWLLSNIQETSLLPDML